MPDNIQEEILTFPSENRFSMALINCSDFEQDSILIGQSRVQCQERHPQITSWIKCGSCLVLSTWKWKDKSHKQQLEFGIIDIKVFLMIIKYIWQEPRMLTYDTKFTLCSLIQDSRRKFIQKLYQILRWKPKNKYIWDLFVPGYNMQYKDGFI